MDWNVLEKRTPVLEPKTKSVASGTLNEEGFASFDLKMKNNRQYILSLSNPTDICYGGLLQHSLNHESNNDVIAGFAHCAYLKINFENVNCFDDNDDFKFYYEGREVPGKEGLGGALAKEATGCYEYANPDFSETPMGKYYYRWDIVRDGVATTVYDTIQLNQGEYYTYNVDY